MKKLVLPLLAMFTFAACGPTEKPAEVKEIEKNKTVESIMNRRSIRKYQDKQIEKTELDVILLSGINAPSAKNLQSWEIRVVQDQDFLQEMVKEFQTYMAKQDPKAIVDSNYSPFYHAPTVIFVANNASFDFSQVDCGLLGQNILLSAESMNIGSCVIGSIARFFNTKEAADMIKRLDLPENYKVCYAISLGYKNEIPDAKPRNAEKIKFIN